MSEKRQRMISGEGYVLLDRDELRRLLAIENRARNKLSQLKADSSDIGRERRKAHIEALEFVLGVAFEMEISRATQEGDLLILTTDAPIEVPEGWQRVK